MNTKSTLLGTFPNTSIAIEYNEARLPVSYNLLKDGDEQATLPVQVGSPETITGYTNEDLITVAIHRLELLNSAYHSPLNDHALKCLKEAKKSLIGRFTITSNKVEVDSVPAMVLRTVKCGENDLRLVIHEGFLFAGYNYGELAKNINTANVATYKDFESITETVDIDGSPLYIGRDGAVVKFKSLSPRGVK